MITAPPSIYGKQLAAMAAGRQRAQRQRRSDAARRVVAYRAWLHAGLPAKNVPEIPSSSDYRLAGGR